MNKYSPSLLNERGQLMLLLAGVGGLLFLMYLLEGLFNPLGYGLIIGIVLYPVRQQPVGRALLYATFFAAGLWLIYDSGHLLIPFVMAYIIAFMINPLVERLEHRKIPRGIIAGLFTVISLGIIGVILFYTIPAVLEQLAKIAAVFNEAATNTEQWIEQTGILTLIEPLGFESELVKAHLVSQVHLLVDEFYTILTDFSSTYISGIGNIFTVIFLTVLMPFLCFFMIRDYEKIGIFVRSLITSEDVSSDYSHDITRIVGSYLRGQFIVVLISAINLSIGFYLVGLPYALLLGIFAGLTNFVPTFGLWVSVTLISIIGAAMGTPWYQYLPGIYIVFGIEQILESGFIVPRVVGHHVGLHPLLVMLSLLLFGFMFGFIGLLIAVPSAALISVFYEQYKQTRKIPFLSGSELDAFMQHFERESQRQEEKKNQEQSKQTE